MWFRRKDGRRKAKKLMMAVAGGDEGMADPRFRMVLTAKGAFAYTCPDGVIVCPLSVLRP